MRWRTSTLAALFVLLAACGGEDVADAPTPDPEATAESGILQPIDKARDTADQVEERQERYGE